MTAPLRWRGWLILAATLVLFSACATTSTLHPITGASATTGPVTVTTNLASYTTSDAIGATVTNTSKTAYYTRNGKSACTVVQLERFNTATGKWTPVDACAAAQQAQPLTIAASSAIPYTLAPTSANDVNAWQAGTYRIVVTYSTQADGVTNPQQARSAAFTVKG
jgi:hypothetical protein